jgi:hypothetical protein
LDFQGPYPHRLYEDEKYFIDRGLSYQVYKKGVDNFYFWVDLIYDMLFNGNTNPYTGKPYVIHPALKHNDNTYTLNELHRGDRYSYSIIYYLPMDRDQHTFQEVELKILYKFELDILGKQHDDFTIRLLFNKRNFRLKFEDEAIPQPYKPYFFLVWFQSHNDFYGSGANFDRTNEHFRLKCDEFLEAIHERQIEDGKPAEYTESEKQKYIHFLLSMRSHNSNPQNTSWLRHFRNNSDLLRFIFSKNSFSEKMKRWCA